MDATNAPAPPNLDCARETSGEAYELTGPREDALKPFVGHVVQISGIRKKAAVEQPVGTSAGEARPTGGFDPLKKDLRLFEVNVTSFQEVTAAAATAPAPAQAPPPPTTTRTQTQPTGTTASARPLPRTASPLPIVALFGLLSFAGALAMRAIRSPQ